MSRFDQLNEVDRSALMATIRKTDTKPEMVVRRLAHAMGHRYRLHRRDLPGTPDLVFPSRKKVIFVHGCFWHRHDCDAGAKIPGRNLDYWVPKLRRNVERDRDSIAKIEEMGWQALVIWECELRNLNATGERIDEFLGA